MAKHTMKRDGYGGYIYRGHKIYRASGEFNGRQFSHWNIVDEFDCCDESANTLRECRYWIDRMCNDQGEA